MAVGTISGSAATTYSNKSSTKTTRKIVVEFKNPNGKILAGQGVIISSPYFVVKLKTYKGNKLTNTKTLQEDQYSLSYKNAIVNYADSESPFFPKATSTYKVLIPVNKGTCTITVKSTKYKDAKACTISFTAKNPTFNKNSITISNKYQILTNKKDFVGKMDCVYSRTISSNISKYIKVVTDGGLSQWTISKSKSPKSAITGYIEIKGSLTDKTYKKIKVTVK
jgi:hypothetical protein